MIEMSMVLVPYCQRRNGAVPLLCGTIWSDGDDGPPVHRFVFQADGVPLAGGVVPKSRSGHRNPLHRLHAILARVDLAALGTDYVSTPWDGIDDLRRTVIEGLRALAAAGPEGTAALEAVTDAVRRLHGAV